MKTSKYLKVIESNLQAFAMSKNLENLIKAEEAIMDLRSKLEKKTNREYAKKLASQFQSLLIHFKSEDVKF